MPVSVRPITESDYALFREESRRVYVTQMMETHKISAEAAEKQAAAEERKILPQGMKTKGLGYFAMKRARDYLRGLGVQKVKLHVFLKNERALDLYKTIGFKTDSVLMSAEL